MVALRTNFSSFVTRFGDYVLSDIFDFDRTTYVWQNLNVTQLKIQPLESQHIILDCDRAQFLFLSFNSPVFLTGMILASQITFGCVLDPCKTNIIVQKKRISSEMLFGLNADQNFRIVLPPDTVLCIFQTSQDLFEKELPLYDYKALLSHPSKTLPFCSPEKSSKLKGYWASLYHQIRKISAENRKKIKLISEESIVEDFIELLADAFPSSSNASQRYSKSYLKNLRRAEMVYEAVAILRANLHQQIRIEDLAKELNVSKRSLSYGFKEMFGIGPIKFLKIERLQNVRQALKKTDPEISKVGIIAEQFGIYSPGHFARDYKQMFGETPSETLKRRR